METGSDWSKCTDNLRRYRGVDLDVNQECFEQELVPRMSQLIAGAANDLDSLEANAAEIFDNLRLTLKEGKGEKVASDESAEVEAVKPEGGD